MPKFRKNPDELTYGESIERFKENPNDPELQEFKKINKKFAETLQSLSEPKMSLPYIQSSESYLLAEQNGLLRAILDQNEQKASPDEISYKFNNNRTFIISRTEEIAINFTTKRGSKYMISLFEVFEDCMEERGEISGKYVEVAIPIAEIIKRLVSKGIRDVNKEWVVSARSNLVTSKIKPAGAGDFVMISEFDNTIQGYKYKKRVLI